MRSRTRLAIALAAALTMTACASSVPRASALPRPLHLLADLLDALPPPVRVSYRDAQDIDDELVAMLEGR